MKLLDIALTLFVAIGFGVYRFLLITQLLQGSWGYTGLSIFTGLLFLPSLTTWLWKTPCDRIGCTRYLAWLMGPLLVWGMYYADAPANAWGSALVLGVMEAIWVPTLQTTLRHQGDRALARGIGLFLGMTCISLIISPLLAAQAKFPHDLFTMGALVAFFWLLRRMILPTNSPGDVVVDRSGEGFGGVTVQSQRVFQAVLLLVGAGFGSLANMIYPVALDFFHLKSLAVGLFACAPLLSFAVGSWLNVWVRTTRHRIAVLVCAAAVPLLFPFTTQAVIMLLLIGLWGMSLGCLEIWCLQNIPRLNDAYSIKNFGLVSGIAMTGWLSTLERSNPVMAITGSVLCLAVMVCVTLWILSSSPRRVRAQ